MGLFSGLAKGISAIFGAKSAAKQAKQAAEIQAQGARDAANAELQGQREAIAFARENLGYQQDVNQPYIRRGAAGMARRDALIGGYGSTAGYIPQRFNPQSTITGGLTGGQSYLPGGGAGGPSGARLYLNQNPDVAAEAQRVGQDPESYAAWHYQTYGQNEGRQSPDALYSSYIQPTTQQAPVSDDPGEMFTQEDVYNEIAANPLFQMADAEYADQSALDADVLSGDLSRAGAFRDETLNRIAAEEARRRAEVTDARSQRDAALTGYIDAWDQRAQVARARAEDQIFGRGGVTGMIGQTRRGVAQVGEDYARDRSVEEYDGRRDILNTYLDDLSGVGQFAYGAKDNAYGGYFDNQETAYANSSDRRQRNVGQRYAGRRAGYGDYLDLIGDQMGDYRQGIQNVSSAASGFAQDASNTARQSGQSRADAYRGVADAQSAGKIARARIWQQGYTNAAKGFGEAADSFGQSKWGKKIGSMIGYTNG